MDMIDLFLMLIQTLARLLITISLILILVIIHTSMITLLIKMGISQHLLIFLTPLIIIMNLMNLVHASTGDPNRIYNDVDGTRSDVGAFYFENSKTTITDSNFEII